MPLIANLNKGESYDGIPILTAPGTHAVAAAEIGQAIPPERRASARVLEIGAGHGAFSHRLLDMGFTDITAWDLNHKRVKAPVSRIEQVDMNNDFVTAAAGRTFDAVVGLELIEHLENPWAFMRGCAKLLRPEGVLVISSPNIESAASRVDFLRNGRFVWFHRKDLEESGHIMPLARWQIMLAAKRAGLKKLQVRSNSENAVVVRSCGDTGWGRQIVALLLSPVMAGWSRGEIFIYSFCLREPKPVVKPEA